MKSSNPYSLQSFLQFLNQNFVLVFVAAVVFGGGFFSGSLWKENRMLVAGYGGSGTATGGAVAGQAVAAPADPSVAAEPPVGDVPPLTNDDHLRGNKNAQVTIIEYSDYECPFCARFHPTMQQVMKDYGDKVAWVYRQYPLPFHPNAQKAAEASECVAKLAGNDKFWEYGDKLFEENNKLGGRLTPEIIVSSAAAVGVNESAFKTCLDSGEMAAKVKAQMDAGTQAGVNGTPGSFILAKDGRQEFVSGAVPIETLKASLDKYVK